MVHQSSQNKEAPDPHGADLPFAFHRQSVLDAAARMRNGLYIYPAIWTVLMQVDGFSSRHFWFVAVNGLILLAASLTRWFYNRTLEERLDRNFKRTRMTFRLLSLVYNVYWGVLSATVLVSPDAENLRWLMLMCTVAITAGGTVILAIDPILPLAYPAALLGPTVLAVLPQGGAVNMALAALTAVFFFYSLNISRVVGADYWARQRAQALLEQRAQELETISRTDALTQVPNRLQFQERLASIWAEASRLGQPIAVAMVDLDHFKRVNDTYGHPFGDRCLQAAARALEAAVHKPSDLLARYGGEEFVILMPNTDLEGALVVAERMLEHITDTEVRQGKQMVRLSCSIGVSSQLPELVASAEAVVQQADAALYLAKQNGRARVESQAMVV
jgi:diguanylate cyclase (GGDEF)-like protein